MSTFNCVPSLLDLLVPLLAIYEIIGWLDKHGFVA
jgi:hypothetical protein